MWFCLFVKHLQDAWTSKKYFHQTICASSQKLISALEAVNESNCPGLLPHLAVSLTPQTISGQSSLSTRPWENIDRKNWSKMGWIIFFWIIFSWKNCCNSSFPFFSDKCQQFSRSKNFFLQLWNSCQGMDHTSNMHVYATWGLKTKWSFFIYIIFFAEKFHFSN